MVFIFCAKMNEYTGESRADYRLYCPLMRPFIISFIVFLFFFFVPLLKLFDAYHTRKFRTHSKCIQHSYTHGSRTNGHTRTRHSTYIQRQTLDCNFRKYLFFFPIKSKCKFGFYFSLIFIICPHTRSQQKLNAMLYCSSDSVLHLLLVTYELSIGNMSNT